MEQSAGASRTNNPLHQDDFALFRLERSFDLNTDLLQERWKAMQRLTHPDNFASQSAAQQRVSLQWSTRINEAYKRLKNPLSRAIYLSELKGLNLQLQTQTRMPEDFLNKQMSWHEALAESTSAADMVSLTQEVQQAIALEMSTCEMLLGSQSDWDSERLANSLRAWVFMDRFLASLKERSSFFQSNS